MAHYRFDHCQVIIDDERRRVRTIFDDGAITLAEPMLDQDSIDRAAKLGYRGDPVERVWQMTRWHDLLHTVVAEAIGHPFSPTLHAVAHGDYRLAPGVVEQEERLVLFVQRMLAEGAGRLLAGRLVA